MLHWLISLKSGRWSLNTAKLGVGFKNGIGLICGTLERMVVCRSCQHARYVALDSTVQTHVTTICRVLSSSSMHKSLPLRASYTGIILPNISPEGFNLEKVRVGYLIIHEYVRSPPSTTTTSNSMSKPSNSAFMNVPAPPPLNTCQHLHHYRRQCHGRTQSILRQSRALQELRSADVMPYESYGELDLLRVGLAPLRCCACWQGHKL